jgi:PAS domain S-box-containing protein
LMQLTTDGDLHNIVLTAPIGICILDAATLVSEIVNDKFLEVAGKPYDAIAGKFYWDSFAEARPYYEAALNDVVQNGAPYYANEIELMLIRHGKEEMVFVTFVYSPIKNEDGKVTKVAVWVLENTLQVVERRKLEENTAELQAINEELVATNEELAAVNEEMVTTTEELLETQANVRRSERFFRSIAVNIPNSLIIVIDKSHKYVIVEGDLMAKMGYDRRDYEGKHPTEIGQTERYLASKHLYDQMMAGEKFSVERTAATGENFLVHFVPLKNEHGEVDAGLIMAIEVTAIKQAEEKSAKLAAIVESSDDAIISKTLESVITSWNSAAERMFGYTADEIIGETIYKLIPPDRQNEEPLILSRLKGGERVEHFETVRLTKDGKLLDVSLTISPIKDPQGNIIGLSKIARDITERKQNETRKSDFIGMVSHELKTPLTSLNAIMQVVSAKLRNSDDSFLTGAMEKANIQVKRMTAMINGFLNISRLEAGKILIEKEILDLGELLDEVLDETRLIASTHIINLVGTGRVMVNADRDRISSVVSNLVSNAVKYSPKGQLIEIDYNIRGEMVVVSIKDEGMGIKPIDINKIFDRYYRVESNHTRHISGFGIGLYLSAEIVDRHDGKIWAESESGKGSTFYFSLPLA